MKRKAGGDGAVGRAAGGGGVMLALTLWPEWAYAICYLGKTIENRGWTPPRNLSRFCIHAGKNIGGNGRDIESDVGMMLQIASDAGYRWDGKAMSDFAYPEYLRLIERTIEEIRAMSSALVCAVRLDGMLAKRPQNMDGWHAPDSFGWKLADIQRFAPIPCKGAQGLWNVPEEQAQRIRELLSVGVPQ
jgi:hypothetical protein